ncbi:hypothetical protein OE749_12600 [Aestuariibacter sp. AA17]|uniref:Phage shock protein B n=1 Tax=Fluctibacter corallii TaxID=2984329 RepID=A0ABT3AA34_9ALTE|nr:hypothetical protein [Aestuariibacter sp. AA17]MCV2885536.1 hypothetical protein [Aestuariibacter sp. AA17]
MNLTAIFIVGIVCWAIVELVNGGGKRKLNKKTDVDNDALRQEVRALKERVEILERIVTDEKYDLKRQFDNLNKDNAA